MATGALGSVRILVRQEAISSRRRSVVIVVDPHVGSVLHPLLDGDSLMVCEWLVALWVVVAHRGPQDGVALDGGVCASARMERGMHWLAAGSKGEGGPGFPWHGSTTHSRDQGC